MDKNFYAEKLSQMIGDRNHRESFNDLVNSVLPL